MQPCILHRGLFYVFILPNDVSQGLQCIKQWRDKQNKSNEVLESGNTKKCPMCRAPSRFITPSSKFWKDGTDGKQKATQAFTESMARVPCR